MKTLSSILHQILPALIFYSHHADSFVVCPYCDPNYMAYPNLEEAMRGYDVPMGDPNPGKGLADPGIRNQIFSPMKRNQDGHYVLDTSFVTANHQIKCDATWSSQVFDNFKDYVNGKIKASTTGLGIEFGPSISAEVGEASKQSGAARLGASMSFPPLFSRSWSDTNDIEEIEKFFEKEQGSIVTTEAICLTNQVDIGLYSRKMFVDPFIDAIKALHLADDEELRLIEFKRFVNEFGTHYASTSEMGTKLTIERRYSAKERAGSDENDLKNCNTLAGAKIFGLQTEESHFNCKNRKLIENTLDSKTTDRMIVTTYGSFIAKSLAEWSQQVISLVQADTFSPRAIRRELSSLIHLFEEKNFPNLTLENGEVVNITKIKSWMGPMMANYCTIFKLNCNKTGCGYDDNCSADQWCINQSEPPGFQCEHKNMTIILENGRKYIGEVDPALEPDGFGLEFYPSGALLYKGEYKRGLKDGQGIFYYESGLKGYEGGFKNNYMDGKGTLFSMQSGNTIFSGKMDSGNFLEGEFFSENGTLAESIA